MEKNKLCESCKFFLRFGDELHIQFANIYKYWVETFAKMRYNGRRVMKRRLL